MPLNRNRFLPVAPLEIEPLESRVLLSGIGNGLDERRVTFTDQDGDRVLVRLKGGGTFDIQLTNGLKNRGDIAGIQVQGNIENSVLEIRATSRKVRGNGIEGRQHFFTPGFTSVFDVDVESDIRGINTFSAAIRNLEVDGNLEFLTSVLTRSQSLVHQDGSIPTQNHDLGSVMVNGNLDALTFQGREDGSNALDGLIWVGGNLGTLDAEFSDVTGGITVGGNIGEMSIHNLLSNIVTNDFDFLQAHTIAGDITMNSGDFSDTFQIEAEEVLSESRIDQGNGSLNIQLIGEEEEEEEEEDEYVFAGVATATNQITLFADSLAETTILEAGQDLVVTTSHVDGLLTAGDDVLLFDQGSGFNGVGGTITGRSINEFDDLFITGGAMSATLHATDGNIGDIFVTSSGTVISGKIITDEGDIGNLTAPGFNGAVVESSSDIGNITATSTGIQNSSFEADNIDFISSNSNNSATAAIGSSRVVAGNTISGVSASNPSSANTAISSSFFQAGDFIGNIGVAGGVNLSTFLSGFEVGDDISQGSRSSGTINSASISGNFTSSNLLAGTIGSINISLPGAGGSFLKPPGTVTPSGAILAHALSAIQVGGGAQEYNGVGAPFDGYLDYNGDNLVSAGEIRVQQLGSTLI